MGRTVGILLVGRSQGRRKIRWATAFLISCALGFFGAAVAAATYFLLSGTFSLIAALLGFGGPFITVGSVIQRALNLPMEKLTPLNGSPA